ncbi:ribonuclease III domain-containing protein [Pseudomassariella vexata]|uniref:Ribonuclease III domain-containing protein n=1 Tax=Pseudomassariella vexata TaxID=1141098 RepID=A0A1Y2DYL3_9PEZI|nr:ribonuclease III domain-containing protein [Pseudomassariella vexata]ORY64196.1 ribonuclease III domain-containing protein [Pseudomassariella vexata]
MVLGGVGIGSCCLFGRLLGCRLSRIFGIESAFDNIAPAIESLSRSLSSESSKARKVEDRPKQSLRIPTSVTLTPWSPIDDFTALPPLPPILDPALDQAVFTHSGMVTKPGEMSYERLEWIGDAYLYLMATAFIYQTFPELPAGRASQYRETLIKNLTLSKYTVDYGLNNRTRFPAEFDLHGRLGGNSATQKNKRKVLGDVFEAYVAGAILGDPEQGLARVSAWMKALWSKELSEEIRKEFNARQQRVKQPNGQEPGTSSQAPVQDLNPKVHLSKAIGATGVKISYRDEGEPKKEKKTGLPWYTVGVYLDGWGVTNLPMGFGSALSKKEAGSKAAQAAFDNKKMIKGFVKKKQELMAAVEATGVVT